MFVYGATRGRHPGLKATAERFARHACSAFRAKTHVTDPAVDANGGGISGWGSLLLSRRAQSTEARLGSRWLLACLAIQLRHARLPALPRAVCRVRLLSIGVRPAAALTPFLSIFGHVLCAGPRTAAREHSVAVQLFAAASRLMVMAFECDAVSLVMMESGKPKYSTLDATTQSFLPCFS